MAKSKNLYVYSISRLRARETKLLDSKTIDSLVDAADMSEICRILTDKGWEISEDNPSKAIQVQTDLLWAFARELIDDMSEIAALRAEKDFHNLKAALKSAYMNIEPDRYFLKYGLVDTELIKKAVSEKDFSLLPEFMKEIAQEAFEALFKRGDSQWSDSVIDKGSLEASLKFSENSSSQLLKDYCVTRINISDLKIAIRGAKAGKDKEFFEKFLVTTKDFGKDSLAEAAVSGEEAVYEYLERTEYKDAVEMLKEDFASFERWCDDKIVAQIRREKHNPFTLSPIVAYIIAREIEIKNVGIIIVAKRNDFEKADVQKRMRQMYV